MSAGELTADQILALLHELAHRLTARGIRSDIKLIGGAALTLQGVGNGPTADIDASYADMASVCTYRDACEWLRFTRER